LVMKKNKFAQVPPAVFLLINLKFLDLSFNELKDMPESLVDMYRLEELLINDNKLQRLPWRMNRLRRLRTLAITSNDFHYLPTTLSEMESLDVFEFQKNPLDRAFYGDQRAADDLLLVLKKQRVPIIYIEEMKKKIADRQAESTPVSKNGKVLRQLLKYNEGVTAIREFTRKERNYENIEFYLSVMEFKQNYNSRLPITHSELLSDARRIYDRFIADTAKDQVNLPGGPVKSVREKFADMKINQWVFDAAFHATFDLMAQDTFLRFRMAPAHKDLITKLERIMKITEEKKLKSVLTNSSGSSDDSKK